MRADQALEGLPFVGNGNATREAANGNDHDRPLLSLLSLLSLLWSLADT